MTPPIKKNEPGFILLAAGKSERLGSNKLLASVDSTQPIVLQTATRILSVSERLLVVSNQHDTAVNALLDGVGASRTSTPDSSLGMAHSLSYGVQQRPHWGGWIICLADMPAIKPSTYRDIQHALKTQQLVVPQHQGKQGNPVGFSKSFFDELLALKGDRGAKSILLDHFDQTHYINCVDPGIFLDADTPQDLEVLKSLE